jgi:hypothetical protein
VSPKILLLIYRLDRIVIADANGGGNRFGLNLGQEGWGLPPRRVTINAITKCQIF